MRLTEEEFNKLINKNKNLKISQDTKSEIEKIQIIKAPQPKIEKVDLFNPSDDKVLKSKSTSIDLTKIKDSISNSKKEIYCNEKSIFIWLDGARLLSVNQIFSILQYRKYEIFSYKKLWHKTINDLVLTLSNKPFFSDKVKITLFRQAKNLVDMDAMTVMFKFVIDALKDNEKNEASIFPEDSPTFVYKIETKQNKGNYAIGIKIESVDSDKSSTFILNEIVSEYL